MDIDSMFEFPIYELRLDTSSTGENEMEKIKAAQLGAGEVFSLQCTVVGEADEKPDLTWLKDGKDLNQLDSADNIDLPPGSRRLGKSIVFKSGFNVAKHSGVYECSVKRKDEKYHRNSIRLEQKPGNLRIADGFTVCPTQENHCHNEGICMMHKASKSISCLCPMDHIGERCEEKPIGGFIFFNGSPPKYQAAFVAMSATIIAFLIFMFICFCYSMKQRRQIKRLVVRVNRLPSSDCPDQESSPLNYTNDQLNSDILAKLQSIDVRADQYCWNCGSAQLIRGKPPVAALNAARRAHFFRDFSQPTESVYSMTSNESREMDNKGLRD